MKRFEFVFYSISNNSLLNCHIQRPNADKKHGYRRPALIHNVKCELSLIAVV